MIKGIGVDIIEIVRIQHTIEESGERFLGRIFTPQEIAYCKSKQDMYQHFAARFAAKEAMSKALSTGWVETFRWKDVEVMNDRSGQPRITVHGRLKESLAASSILVTISHSESHAVAMVLIEEQSL
jgi:holo-[acyl-carrier protein] synthase